MQVVRLRDGEQSGREVELEEVLRAEAGRLFSIAVCILRSPAAAEDAVQDTMVLAWRRWDALRDPDRRRAWLTRICVRRCLRIREGDERRSQVPLDGNVASTTAEPSDVDWDRAFALLSPAQRAVVTLHYLHGHRLDDCAQLMGCRPGTVRRHLARALTKLRTEIGHE
jgi:RNA polymerase sigma factor (sigma-70 family)